MVNKNLGETGNTVYYSQIIILLKGTNNYNKNTVHLATETVKQVIPLMEVDCF